MVRFTYPRCFIRRGSKEAPLIPHYTFEQAEDAFELVKAGRQDVFKVMIAVVS